MRIQALVPALLLTLLAGTAPAQDKDKGIAGRQTAFLKAVKGEKIKEAYEDLLEGSLILEKKGDVENLVKQTEKAVALYGDVTSIEDFGVVKQDKHLASGLGMVCCEKAPLFFYFIWYRNKPDAPWRLHNVWFDDNSKAFLEHRK
jgi:hypothetical protein